MTKWMKMIIYWWIDDISVTDLRLNRIREIVQGKSSEWNAQQLSTACRKRKIQNSFVSWSNTSRSRRQQVQQRKGEAAGRRSSKRSRYGTGKAFHRATSDWRKAGSELPLDWRCGPALPLPSTYQPAWPVTLPTPNSPSFSFNSDPTIHHPAGIPNGDTSTLGA